MTIEEFNIRYSEKGGIQKLTEMRDNCATLKVIANQFGLSRERIRQLMIEMYGIPYDPRVQRRERKINSIRELLKMHGVERTKQMYRSINRAYLKEAMK